MTVDDLMTLVHVEMQRRCLINKDPLTSDACLPGPSTGELLHTQALLAIGKQLQRIADTLEARP